MVSNSYYQTRSSGRKSNSKKYAVIFVLFIIFNLCYNYDCPAALDLGRYYEEAWS